MIRILLVGLALVCANSEHTRAQNGCTPAGCAPTQVPQPQHGKEFLAGGPFVIHGFGIVACQNANSARMLNTDDPAGTYGRVAAARAMSYGGCRDYPNGLPVLVRGIGRDIAQVIPDVHAVVTPAYVPLSAVTTYDNKPITNLPSEWVEWKMATGQGTVR